MRLLFEGGFYSRAAFIRGRLLFEGGFCSRIYGMYYGLNLNQCKVEQNYTFLICASVRSAV